MTDVQERTLQYYNDNASEFTEQTRYVNFAETQQAFIKYIPIGGRILDFGCGAGRDSHYFLSRGYRVTALDGSASLALRAEEYIQQKVVRMAFEDFAEVDAYDGVWACASLLHLPWTVLGNVVRNLAASLHEDGVFYASFKYGDFAGMRNGRYFTDMTEKRWQELTKDLVALETSNVWITEDVREGRSNELWLNLLGKKRD